MRIGVDFRFLAVGPGLITRGICRYTQQQLRHVLASRPDDEFVLLCNAGTDLSLIAADVRNAENVSLSCYSPPAWLAMEYGDLKDALEMTEHYQAWVAAQGIDVYHATSPFLPDPPRILHFDACPMVATFYDVIPLLFPEHYHLDDPRYRTEYVRALDFVKGADRVLAISDCARDDAVTHAGIPRERIDRAWPIPDEVFRPLEPHMLDKLLLVIGSRIRLPERYVLTVSALHHAKNLDSLLRGYALLSPVLRTAIPLVICCYLDPDSERALRRLAAELGVDHDVVVTGHVTDEELCALYNRATVVVHPSRYEGFGLPVVEAMRCGAPVVTTTTSSLPEVAGDAALLVDPSDHRGFADAIALLAAHEGERDELRARGFEQAKRFSAAQLAQGTFDSYRRALWSDQHDPDGGRLRLAVWTPLPPQQSGIADYAGELLGALSQRCDIEVFVDGGYLPDKALRQRCGVHHFSAFQRRAAKQPFDAVIYQVGVFGIHDYMSDALETVPGIVVLHDLAWSPVLYDRFYRSGDREGFRRLLVQQHGRRALEELIRLDAAGGGRPLREFLVRHPMLELVIGAGPAQIVLSQEAADELRGGYPGADPWIVPMGVADPYEGRPGFIRETARCQLDIPSEAFVAGVFGIVDPVKRLEVCIRALARVVETRPDALLLVVGRAPTEGYVDHLARLADRLGVGSHLRFTGHLPKHLFDACMVASDVIVNLRDGTHTHTSAAIMRGIAVGRPIILSDLPAWRSLPAPFCRRVPLGEAEEGALVRELLRLAADPASRSRMSEAARTFYEQEGTLELMTMRYLEVVDRLRQRGGYRPRQSAGAEG